MGECVLNNSEKWQKVEDYCTFPMAVSKSILCKRVCDHSSGSKRVCDRSSVNFKLGILYWLIIKSSLVHIIHKLLKEVSLLSAYVSLFCFL